MARTYAMLGTRSDLGGALIEAQLTALARRSQLSAASQPVGTWGLGLFDQDEVLISRGKSRSEGGHFITQPGKTRTHAALAHECDGSLGHMATEATPPLRYGHLLFTCQGVSDKVEPLVHQARRELPEFLQSVVRGETWSELAFALLLAELPTQSLARSRQSEPKRSANPIQSSVLIHALRAALQRLDSLSAAAGQKEFLGDLWLHSGESMFIAHREGQLGLQVLRGRSDLEQLGLLRPEQLSGAEHSLFVTAAATPDELPPTWERLPDHLLISAQRGALPQTQSL